MTLKAKKIQSVRVEEINKKRLNQVLKEFETKINLLIDQHNLLVDKVNNL